MFKIGERVVHPLNGTGIITSVHNGDSVYGAVSYNVAWGAKNFFDALDDDTTDFVSENELTDALTFHNW